MVQPQAHLHTFHPPRGFAPLSGEPWLTLTWSWHYLMYALLGGIVALWGAVVGAEAVTHRWPTMGLVMAFVPVLVTVSTLSVLGALITRRLRCSLSQWCPACLRAMRRGAHVCPSCHYRPTNGERVAS
jgi:hypothetical protein